MRPPEGCDGSSTLPGGTIITFLGRPGRKRPYGLKNTRTCKIIFMAQPKSKLFSQDLAFNKKATFDYQVLDALEAGMVLTGGETKSAKLGHIHLNGAFVVPHGQELFLVNCLIEPYQSKETLKETKTRSIKLLLKRKEIDYLTSKIKASGLTLIPLKVYNKRGLVKVEIALAKGKKAYDKRETIKKRDDLARIHRGED